MKNNRLLVISVVLMVIVLAGILATAWFVSTSAFGDRPPYGSGMMQMMGGGMMGRGHMHKMMQEMMSGRLPPGIKPESLPEADSANARLFTHYCSQCHNLPSPAMHAAEEWPGIEARMFERMQRMARMKGRMDGMMRRGMMTIQAPSEEEISVIISYLQQHALKPASPETLGPPDTQGLALFRNICSQCHALPDPQLHTADEWPDIVERMRGNMQAMEKPVITEVQKEQIASYLSQHAR
jgi:mono/diheme cytochrome c family protein